MAEALKLENGLRDGTLKHLTFDTEAKRLEWRKPQAGTRDDDGKGFYGQFQPIDIADVFRLVEDHCGFLSELTPLQPRYAKKFAGADTLMATILAQALNIGNHAMARTSDIPYHVLSETHKQYLRLATLKKPTNASPTPSPSCRSSLTTPSTWRCSTAPSMARSLSPPRRPRNLAILASTLVPARAW